MAKKEYATATDRAYFNKRVMPKSSTGLMEKIIKSGEKVLDKAGAEGYARWSTFDKFQEQFDGCWDYNNSDFLHWWLDQAIREVDFWVFNMMMQTLGRNERKSEGKSEEVCKQFRKLWE